MSKQKTGNRYQCLQCSYRAPRYLVKQHHAEKHLPLVEVPYLCDTCGKRLTSKEKADRHLKSHPGATFRETFSGTYVDLKKDPPMRRLSDEEDVRGLERDDKLRSLMGRSKLDSGEAESEKENEKENKEPSGSRDVRIVKESSKRKREDGEKTKKLPQTKVPRLSVFERLELELLGEISDDEEVVEKRPEKDRMTVREVEMDEGKEEEQGSVAEVVIIDEPKEESQETASEVEAGIKGREDDQDTVAPVEVEEKEGRQGTEAVVVIKEKEKKRDVVTEEEVEEKKEGRHGTEVVVVIKEKEKKRDVVTEEEVEEKKEGRQGTEAVVVIKEKEKKRDVVTEGEVEEKKEGRQGTEAVVVIKDKEEKQDADTEEKVEERKDEAPEMAETVEPVVEDKEEEVDIRPGGDVDPAIVVAIDSLTAEVTKQRRLLERLVKLQEDTVVYLRRTAHGVENLCPPPPPSVSHRSTHREHTKAASYGRNRFH